MLYKHTNLLVANLSNCRLLHTDKTYINGWRDAEGDMRGASREKLESIRSFQVASPMLTESSEVHLKKKPRSL